MDPRLPAQPAGTAAGPAGGGGQARRESTGSHLYAKRGRPVTVLPLMYGAAAGWALAAVVALAAPGSRPVLRACCGLSGLAGAAALGGGAASLISGNSRVVTAGGS